MIRMRIRSPRLVVPSRTRDILIWSGDAPSCPSSRSTPLLRQPDERPDKTIPAWSCQTAPRDEAQRHHRRESAARRGRPRPDAGRCLLVSSRHRERKRTEVQDGPNGMDAHGFHRIGGDETKDRTRPCRTRHDSIHIATRPVTVTAVWSALEGSALAATPGGSAGLVASRQGARLTAARNPRADRNPDRSSSPPK
jgi:hypothetical protein